MKKIFEKIVDVLLIIILVAAALDLIVMCIIGGYTIHLLVSGILTLSGGGM